VLPDGIQVSVITVVHTLGIPGLHSSRLHHESLNKEEYLLMAETPEISKRHGTKTGLFTPSPVVIASSECIHFLEVVTRVVLTENPLIFLLFIIWLLINTIPFRGKFKKPA
jgi:hypothetical protein